jgi:serine/threonine protein kinase/WD40 repeat protein
MFSSNAERNPVDVLAEEFAGRLRRGERPSLGEYTEKYPQHAEQIRKVFPALVMMEQLKPAAGDLTGDLGSAPPEEPVTRECLGDYRIVREVGRGAMGVVYEAEQLSLGRHVALKVLASVALRSATAIERFQREAMAAARLHHTNIVPVFGVGESDGVRFYVMQFIRGEGIDKVLADVRRLRKLSAGTIDGEPSIAQSLVRGRFTADATLSTEKSGARSCLAASATVAEPPSAVPLSSSALSEGSQDDYYRAIARIEVQAADALGYAHRQRIVHRDIKPSNLLLDLQGTLWITDFGLAKAEGLGDLTQSGDIVGTLRYMAPERFDGRSLPQSDIYALGVTLYEMLTLQPAFDASEKAALIARVYREQPTPPRKIDRAIPRDLETVVQKCLAKEPEHRYKTAEALAEDLRRFLADRPILARQTSVREQAWRWCRRNPALASLVAAVVFLLSLVAVISTAASIKLGSRLQQVHDANQEAQAKLWDSYLSQARANRMTGRPGQRFATLRAIQEAMKLPLPDGRSLDELRTEAIAALCLPDLEVEREWKLHVMGQSGLTIADTFERYAYADKDGNVSVRRLDDHTELYRLPGEGSDWYLETLPFSPDGRFQVQRCKSDAGWQCQLWKLDGAEQRRVLSASNTWTWAFSPDSRQIAIIQGKDRAIRVHDTDSGHELRRFRFQHEPGSMLRWNPRRPLLAEATSSGWRTINTETGEVVGEEASGIAGFIRLAWHPEGRLLAMANDATRQITIWDTQTRQRVLPPLEGHRHRGIVLRFNHAGDLLLSNDWTWIWRMWDVRTGKQVLTQPGQGCLCFRPDDSLVGADIDENSRVRLFRLRSGREFRTLVHRTLVHQQSPRTGEYGRSVLDPEGRLLAVETREGVALVDVMRGEEVELLPRPGNRPLRFEACGEALWTYGRNGVCRWPIQTDSADRNKRRVGPARCMVSNTSWDVFGSTPEMNIVAIPNYDQGALLWQRAANHTLPLGPQVDVRYCAVSPDGRWVATGSHNWEGGVKVWDAQSGQHVADLPITSHSDVQFSPDSKWLLTSGGGARIWRAGTWQEGPVLGGPTSLSSVGAFTREGNLLALEDVPSVVRLVWTATGKEVARLTAPEQTRLTEMCFTPDSSQLITRGVESGALHIFDLHAIRRGLREIGLDWSDEPLPAPRIAAAKVEPLDIRVVQP